MPPESDFRLSESVVDFGCLDEEANELRSLVIRGPTGDGAGDYQVDTSEDWLVAFVGSYLRDGCELMLCVDAGQLPGAGTHRAVVSVCDGHTMQRCEVVIHVGRGLQVPVHPRHRSAPEPIQQTASVSETPQPSKREPAGAESMETRSSRGQEIAGSPRQATRSGLAFPPEAGFSLGLAVLLLVGLATVAYVVTAAMFRGDASGEAAPATASENAAFLVVWWGTGFAYLVFVFRALVFDQFGLSAQRARSDQEAEVQQLVRELCERLDIGTPRVRIVDSAVPNVRSVGISPSCARIEVSHALIETLVSAGGQRALQAALAHEVIHVQLFDTLLFSVLGPLLAMACNLMMLLSRARSAMGQAARGISAGPLIMLPLLAKGSPVGCLIALFVGLLLIGLLFTLLFYLAWLVLGLVVLIAACLAYSRYIEARADLRAVQLLGENRGMLDALAGCLPAYPDEMARVHRYARAHLPQAEVYDLDGLLASLDAGGDPQAGVSMHELLFRSHPPFMARLACVAACGPRESTRQGEAH